VKSGYGLTPDDEIKSLRVIRRLQQALPLRVVPTFLGAHEIPIEYRVAPRTRAEYIALIVEEMLPRVAAEGLAAFADIFCEPGVYTTDEARVILGAARRHGLQLKLHADGRTAGAADSRGTRRRQRRSPAAVSEGASRRSPSGRPSQRSCRTMLFLGRPRQAPARALLDAGAAVALASDFNPGTSPTVNFPLILTLAVSQLRMSVSEAVLAATVNGAAALGLAAETGQVAPGFSDLALFDIEDVRELPTGTATSAATRPGSASRPMGPERGRLPPPSAVCRLPLS
jgi:imidazolonepropionase